MISTECTQGSHQNEGASAQGWGSEIGKLEGRSRTSHLLARKNRESTKFFYPLCAICETQKLRSDQSDDVKSEAGPSLQSYVDDQQVLCV